jgi:hypothetical protein
MVLKQNCISFLNSLSTQTEDVSGLGNKKNVWTLRETLQNEELQNLCSSSNIIQVMRARKMRWVVHVEHIVDMRIEYKILYSGKLKEILVQTKANDDIIHSDDCEEYCLLGSDTVESGRSW